jgi:hypothetical protein
MCFTGCCQLDHVPTAVFYIGMLRHMVMCFNCVTPTFYSVVQANSSTKMKGTLHTWSILSKGRSPYGRLQEEQHKEQTHSSELTGDILGYSTWIEEPYCAAATMVAAFVLASAGRST